VLGVVGAALAAATLGNVSSSWATFSESNHQHVTGSVKYDHSPPAGGAHDAVWQNCGFYSSVIRNENAVHSLEHGAVWITYSSRASDSQVSELRIFAAEHYLGTQKYLVVSPVSDQSSPFVATAWGAQMKFVSLADPKLSKFLNKYQSKGQGGEPNGECTGGTGSPT
jgi:hypothetical protein